MSFFEFSSCGELSPDARLQIRIGLKSRSSKHSEAFYRHLYESFQHKNSQLRVIFDVIGFPSDEDLENFSPEVTTIINNIKRISKNEPKVRLFVCAIVFYCFYMCLELDFLFPCSQGIARMFPVADHLAVQLLEKMILFNPKRRITAKDALQDNFLSNIMSNRHISDYLIELNSLSFDPASTPMHVEEKTKEELIRLVSCREIVCDKNGKSNLHF